jgi:outer membrane receptor protein involved in Fe transport
MMISKKTTNGGRIIALITSLTLVSTNVIGGETPDSPVSLDTITVTAQKRPEDLAKVPVSVNVVSGETIENLGMRRLEDLSLSVPNLTISEGSSVNMIFIRGIGSERNLGYEQSVGMFVDGVYAGRGRQFGAPFLDVERVEVLKGPQGILFGKNTTAGAISIVRAKPGYEVEAKASTLYAPDHGEYFFEGVLSGPLFADLSARLAVRVSSLDGYLDNSVLNTEEPETDEQAYRLTLLWDPLDAMQVTLKHEYSRLDNKGKTTQVIESGAFGPVFSSMDPDFDDNFNQTRSSAGKRDSFKSEFTDTAAHNTALTINYDIAGHMLTSITGFSHYDYDELFDFDFSALPVFDTQTQENFHQISQEFRLSSPLAQTSSWVPWNIEAFDYLVGVYYHYQNFDSSDSVNVDTRVLTDLGVRLPSFAGTRINQIQQNTDNWAVFGQATWHLRENLRLAAGLRYTRENKTIRKDASITDPGMQAASSSLEQSFAIFDVRSHHFDTSRSETHLTPMVNLQWDVTEQNLLYFNFSTAAKGGGFDHGATSGRLANFEFNDERATGFEIGAKSYWFDKTVALDLALFRTEFEDLQVTTFDGFSSFVVNNAAASTTQGVELNSRWKAAGKPLKV